jgi:hypothetical protein
MGVLEGCARKTRTVSKAPACGTWGSAFVPHLARWIAPKAPNVTTRRINASRWPPCSADPVPTMRTVGKRMDSEATVCPTPTKGLFVGATARFRKTVRLDSFVMRVNARTEVDSVPVPRHPLRWATRPRAVRPMSRAPAWGNAPAAPRGSPRAMLGNPPSTHATAWTITAMDKPTP